MGSVRSSNIPYPSQTAYSIPCFIPLADDANSLPAYSPPADRAQFEAAFKPNPKKVLDDLHLASLSLDNITIPTIRPGELSPIESSAASSSGDEFDSPLVIERTLYEPIVLNQNALSSPPLQRTSGLPPPPRAAAHIPRFSTNGEIADMV